MTPKSCIGCAYHEPDHGHCNHVEARTRHPDRSCELARTVDMRRGFLFGLIKGKCGREAKLRRAIVPLVFYGAPAASSNRRVED